MLSRHSRVLFSGDCSRRKEWRKTGVTKLYSEICLHFGIDSVENLVANRRNRFIKRYGERDNYLCQMLR